MSENFDDVNEEELDDELYDDSSEEQRNSEKSAKEKYDQAKDIADRIKRQRERAKSGENGTRSTSDGSASSRRSTADNINREDIPRKKGKGSKGTSKGEEPSGGNPTGGNTSPSGGTETLGQNTAMGEGAATTTTTTTAEGTAATTTAGGTTAATTTAGGTAAAGGSAAAGGAAAGGAAAAAWPVLVAILIIVLIIVIILLIIGAISFFTTVPGMMMDKITEISSGLWQGFKSFFEGNAAYITEEDQTTLAEYIENMGYDVVGYGFATPNEIQVQTENTDTGATETVTIKSKYLFAYLLADYNTYAIDSPVQSTISNFWSWIWGSDKPLTGMLKFDDASWLDITEDVEVDRDSKTVSITVWNPEIEWLNVFNTDTYTYSLEGWTGRYGKPLEFLLTLHIATMAPDLAYHVASDEEFDTKVHINFEDVTAHVKLQYVVKAGAINNIKSEDYEGVVLWEIDGLEYLENQIGADGTLVLSPEDLAEIEDTMVVFDPLIGPTQYDDDVVEAIEAIGMTKEGLRDAVSLCEENGGEGKELKTRQPYITYVDKAWYKNIYFVINNSIRSSVTEDSWLQSAPDFDAYEYIDAGEIITDPYDFHPSADSDQSEIVSDTSLGVYQVLERKENKQITQKSQPLKGATNPRIKELFVGAGNNDIEGTNPKPEYYIYDGSLKTAEAIENLRQLEATFRASGNPTEAEVSEYINSIDDDDLYREIDFNKNSLTALTILENMQTEDADFILRDFKSLLVELKYFKASDLADKNVGLLDWIVPDYNPAEWPNRKFEKQNYEYGTYIKSKTSIEQLITNGELDADAVENSKGFESGAKVIAPGIGEVTKVSSNSITIKFTETNLVKDMTMTISGFTVNSSISVGQMLNKEQEIGTTTTDDILVILRAPNKSIIENIEDYMPSPSSIAGTSAYYGDLTEDELEMFAAVLFSENGTNEDTMAAVANVVKNRALDTVHFVDVNTITDVLIAPGQYAVVHKVPGSGSGPTPGGGESSPPAGKRTFALPGKGEYWITQDATDISRQVAREVIDGVRPDTVSAQMGKLALFQRTATAHPNADSCCVVLGEIYSHSWGCLDGNHVECSCTLP